MRFASSIQRDFRNLENTRREWGPGLNLILGPNGAGKTNLLESLSVLAGWGPFAARTSGGRIRGTVAWGSPEGRALLGANMAGEEEHEVRVLLSSRMTPHVDGQRATCTDLRLLLPSIVFLPTDIDLIDGPPGLRRLFLDKLCALYHPLYARRLSEFQKVSRNRAALLRQGRSPRITAIPFARLGGWILEARRHVVSLLLEPNDGSRLSLSMLPKLENGGAEYLLSALEETEEREAHALRPLVGPGRDELEIAVRDGEGSVYRPASECLSRGQKRRLVLSLILMSGRLIERRLHRKPVLLFDDLGAELDAENRRRAGELLLDTGWQVFVTGTEDPFPGLEKSVHVLT